MMNLADGWAGILVGVLIAVGLTLGYFVISWLNRSWFRQRLGFEDRETSSPSIEPVAEEVCPEDSAAN